MTPCWNRRPRDRPSGSVPSADVALPRMPPGPPRSYQYLVITEGQLPGRQGALCVSVALSVALVDVQAELNCHGGVQVTIRHTTGP